MQLLGLEGETAPFLCVSEQEIDELAPISTPISTPILCG